MATAPLAALGVRLSPAGHLHLVATGGGGDPADPGGGAGDPSGAEARIRAAFARGAGHGLLQLGAVEVETALSPGLSWLRELGRRFVAAVCGLPDLAARRERVSVPAPALELGALASGAPPMEGVEYLDAGRLEALWREMEAALREELAQFPGTVEEFLHGKHAAWNVVGRVCFHLAENRADEERPFAFLATYSTRLSQKGKPQHRPLGDALREHAGAKNQAALLALLSPVERAAQRSALVRELSDSGELYHPLAWTPAEAHRFLREVPRLEEAGVVVRVPDWWSARRPPRLQVGVTIGGKEPAKLGLDALLDFSVAVTLDGAALTDEEWREALAAGGGLSLLRGRWVEIDPERLREVLAHWKGVQREAKHGGLSFIEGMRLLAGARAVVGADPIDAAVAEWSHVDAGRWLGQALEGLRTPEGIAAPEPGEALRATLRPYQRDGVRWLWFLHRLGLGACLADDMGLGKTIQVLALLLILKRERDGGPHLLVVPASLIGNWQSEIERFAPSLRTFIAHPSAAPAAEVRSPAASRLAVDLVITTYGSVHRLPWIAEQKWRLVILDEAQAVKNPAARQTRAVKALAGRGRIALTGTPVENRLGDLWSLFDFLNPGLLGSAKAFGEFAKRLGAAPASGPGTATGYGPLRALTRPYILRRMKTDRAVVADLPDKTEVRAFCPLSRRQAALYQQSVDELGRQLGGLDGMKRRGAVLAFLMGLKQICNHPAHFLKSGAWDEAGSGKLGRVREIAEEVASRQEKMLVFTQFREATEPLAEFLAGVFGRAGLVLHGGTPIGERKRLVDRFQEGEDVPFFVLSVKAGGTGLNLTAATHVLHFDRWWNPAVEDQATDRAYRIGQKKNVLVHKLVCRGTVEERIDALIESKKALSRELLSAGGEALLTEMGDRELLDLVSLDMRRALEEG